jgi:hypothetical protein
MMDQASWWLAYGNGSFQGRDGKILLQPVARFPIDNAAGIQVQNDGEIQPSLTGPDITDIPASNLAHF